MLYPSFSNLKNFTFLFAISILVSLSSCKNENKTVSDNATTEETKLFTIINSTESNIHFQNTLEETINFNYYKYNYTYIGAGVATADFNNDGLEDIFFISNSFDNKLYLNKGDFKFEDITKSAGIIKRKGFDTGVSVADVNNDGYLDIYISRGGFEKNDNKFANMLYINNGDLTFTERAEELGLADANRTIQASFFDYDNDNDIDIYISNTPDITGRTEVLDLDKIQKDPKTLELKGSDKLYNNDGTGHFTDVSVKAGLQYDIGFGLNPQVGDLNGDGWLDIYVSNDFNVPDLAYINNGNGTFTESRDKIVKHMTFNSMGSDIADLNNDGLFDFMVLDMNPQDYIRSKTTMAMTSVDQFELMVSKKYHYQYMHNMLQLNNGNNTFSEISKMAGMADTDWSWSLLSADFDLDGFNDIYITNGVFRDVMDRDKLGKTMNILRANGRKPTDEDFLAFAKMLPQQKLNNYFYKNNGDLTFEDTSSKWVEGKPTFSNGAAYADLDNDGDLDIIVNNINDEATILKNNATDQKGVNYLEIQLIGPEKNKFGLGAVAKIYLEDGTSQIRQLINTRGFLSSISNTLHFGIAKNRSIKKIEVSWLDGKKNEMTDVDANQLVKINYNQSSQMVNHITDNPTSIFSKLPSNYAHIDPYFNDYNRQVLLPHKLSQTGPGIAKSDVNEDGLEDIYLGGGNGQSGQLLFGNKDGSFTSKLIPDFNFDKNFEDQGALFFDADNDGDQDLYVVSGSYEFKTDSSLLQDRLYLNNGNGEFIRAKNNLPQLLTSGSIIKAADYDNDGDLDLFIGGRLIPAKYPYSPKSYLLENNKGSFTISTKNSAPKLEEIGMVTDAVWTDINGDKSPDLIVTGEWMGIEVFINNKGKLEKSDNYNSLDSSKGWWNKIFVADVDNDGDLDIVAGNLGLNYKFHASYEKPFHIYTNDFDYNGTEDIFLAKYYNDKQVPVRGKGCSSQQMPFLKSKIQSYQDFANRDLEGIVGKGINTALHYTATEFRSGIFINNGDNNFEFKPFQNTIQRSPINSILFDDFDGDGKKDLLLAGNNYQSEVETTRADAGIGAFLKGNNKGDYTYVSNLQSGFFADKDIRDMLSINLGENRLIFVLNNNSKHDLFKINKE
jgi:hypothetical protein